MSQDSKLLMLVEDNVADVILARESLQAALESHRLITFGDGREASEYLAESGNELPNLILLDLNLPRMDGRELLKEMKSSPRLRSIPTVILTTSNAPKDLHETYQLHANSFVTKPVNLDDYSRTLQDIVHYWFETVALPEPGSREVSA